MSDNKELNQEEVISWYKTQIELATLRADLAEQQSRAAKADAERMQATIFMAQVQASKPGEDFDEEEEEAPKQTLKRKK
jgi:hypothetical protein